MSQSSTAATARHGQDDERTASIPSATTIGVVTMTPSE